MGKNKSDKNKCFAIAAYVIANISPTLTFAKGSKDLGYPEKQIAAWYP